MFCVFISNQQDLMTLFQQQFKAMVLYFHNYKAGADIFKRNRLVIV